MKFGLTFDTDWVHQDAVEYVVSLLDKYNHRGTFFATNEYRVFKESSFKHEVGIHPSFNQLLSEGDSNYKSILDHLFNMYPQARGIRSHSLTTSSLILDYSHKLGLLYDSNQYHPSGGEIFLDYSKLYRFTHNYVDLGHLIDGTKLSLESINFSIEYLNIFDFHPIHIYLNTPDLKFYESVKKYTTHKDLKLYRNVTKRGIGDLFLDLLIFLNDNDIQSDLLINHLKMKLQDDKFDR